jgi:hypothetical protein
MIEQFDDFIEDYHEKTEVFSEIENDNYKKENVFKDIFFENNNYYNSEKVQEFIFVSYFTSTNYCTFDDFKNQYLFFEAVKKNKNYPMIDYILKNNNLIEIIDLLPKMNKYINDIYNKLSLKISKNDLEKEIKNIDILREKRDNLDNQINQINSFNDILQKIIAKTNCNINIKITENSKISDILNIEKNEINTIYKEIIKEYNKFLKQTKIYNETQNIEPIIIQSSSEKDYMLFKRFNNNENNMITAKQRLNEIIILCSSRNRIKDKKINVVDGGKINYNYELIENILEEEFLLGKKLFSETQKTFVFSNKYFNEESNNLLFQLSEKYKQKEVNEDAIKQIDNDYKTKDALIDLYYNLQYIIIYLMIYEKNNEYINSETSIEYIIKLIEKGNYKMSDTFTSSPLVDFISVNTLLSVYEKVESNAFQYLTEGIKIEEMQIKKELKDKIENELKNEKLLLNDKILTNGFKKYILRYYLGDNNENLLEFMNKYFADIFNNHN